MTSRYINQLLIATLVLGFATARAQDAAVTPEEGTTSNTTNGTDAAPVSSITTEIKAPAPKAVPVITGETDGLADSDGYYWNENRLGFKQSTGRSLLKTFTGEAVQMKGGANNYAHYSGNKLMGGAELQLTPGLSIAGSIGAGKLTVHDSYGKTFDTSRSMLLWDLTTMYKVTDTTKLKLSGTEDFAYLHFEDQGDGYVMNLRKGALELDTRAIEKWQFKSTATFSYYGDGNERQKYDQLLVREVITEPLTLKAGVSGGWRRFKFRSPQYVSAPHRENYGLRLIGQKALTSSWTLDGDIFYGYDQTLDRKRYNVSRTDWSASYQDKAGWLVRASATFYTFHEGVFWENSANLSLEIPI